LLPQELQFPWPLLCAVCFRVLAWRLALPWLFHRSDLKSNNHHQSIGSHNFRILFTLTLEILIVKILNHIYIKLLNIYSNIGTFGAAVPAAIASGCLHGGLRCHGSFAVLILNLTVIITVLEVLLIHHWISKSSKFQIISL
jgi:hypothetical protein